MTIEQRLARVEHRLGLTATPIDEPPTYDEQIAPLWDQYPDAEWVAMDADGRAWPYSRKPQEDRSEWLSDDLLTVDGVYIEGHERYDWHRTLRERPAEKRIPSLPAQTEWPPNGTNIEVRMTNGVWLRRRAAGSGFYQDFEGGRWSIINSWDEWRYASAPRPAPKGAKAWVVTSAGEQFFTMDEHTREGQQNLFGTVVYVERVEEDSDE